MVLLVHSSLLFNAILYVLSFLSFAEYGSEYTYTYVVHSSEMPPSLSSSIRTHAHSHHAHTRTTRRSSLGENEVRRDDRALWTKEEAEEGKGSIKIGEIETMRTPHLTSNHGPIEASVDSAFIDVTYYNIDRNVALLPDFDNLVNYRKGLISTINFPSTSGMFATSGRFNSIAAVFEGYVVFPYAGNWTFHLTSDDGAKFMIGNMILDNDGIHAPRTLSETFAVDSTGQVEAFKISYFQQGGNSALILGWSSPLEEIKEEIIPVSKCSEEDFICWKGGFGSSRLNSTSQIEFVDGPSSQPTESPAPTKTTKPTFSPSISLSTKPTFSPSISPSPTISMNPTYYSTTTSTSVPNLVMKDKDGRRRFPSPAIDSGNHMTSLEHHRGPSFPLSVFINDYIPSWAGNLHDSTCKPKTTCSHKYPKSNDALSLTLDVVSHDKVGFQTYANLPGADFSTRSIVAADVNNDGKLDLIIGNYGQPNQLLIQRESSNLDFDVFTLPGGNTSTEEIAVADIDFDGHVDIVVGNYGEPNEVLWNENGNGTFFTSYDLPGGNSYTGAIALGDIYGSGNIDIIIGNVGQPNYVLKNSGDCSRIFEKLSDDIIPQDNTYTQAIAVATIGTDAEEVKYIIFGNIGQPNQLLKRTVDEDTTFHEVSGALPQDNSYTVALAVADFDGDGMFEIVVGNSAYSNQLLHFAGEDRFEEIYGAFPVDSARTEAISVADIDGDGKLDVIAANYAQPNQILRNKNEQATVGFEAIRDALPNEALNTWALAVGDMDGDGRVDIVIGNEDQETKLVLNKAGGEFVEIPGALPGSLKTQVVISGDFTGDDKTDIIIGNKYGEPNLLLRNKGYGEFEKVEMGGREMSAWAMSFGDFGNKNGLMDIVIANNWGQDNTIMLNQGDGTFGDEISLPGGGLDTRSIAVTDVDNDGQMDIVIGNQGQMNQILLNTGNITSSGIPLFDVQHLEEEDDSKTREIRVADVDNDGYLDIIIGNYGQPNRLLLNLKDGTFSNHIDLPGGNMTETFAVADLDSDGAIDLIIGNRGEPNIILWNDGDGNFTTSPQDLGTAARSMTSETTSIIAADIDGDGLADIIVGNDGEPNELLFNMGNGSFTELMPGAIPGSSSNTASVAVGDVDGDGSLDLIIGNYGGVANQLIQFSSCPNGGARLHAASWCFRCPSFMGRPVANGKELSLCRECLPDYMQEPGNGERCDSESCPLQMRLLGQDNCRRCANGTFYDSSVKRIDNEISSWDEKRCALCLIGTYYSILSPPAIDNCFQCPQGAYQNQEGSSDCNLCVAGKYQPDRGSELCKSCKVGGYCDPEDNTSNDGGFIACHPGTYNNETGMSSVDACVPCPSGTFSIQTEASSSSVCEPCPPGQYNNGTGATKCDPCEKGTYQKNNGSFLCESCTEGTYSTEGSEECITCPYRLNTTSAGSETCSVCDQTFYLKREGGMEKDGSNDIHHKIFKKPDEFCEECPPFANCIKNTNIKTLGVPLGYWRDSDDTTTLYRCRHEKLCVGNLQSIFNNRNLNESSRDKYCKTNHTGPLCEVCSNDSQYFNETEGECTDCPKAWTILLRAGLAIAFTFFFLLLARARISMISTNMLNFSFRAKYKILFSFYQIVTNLPILYGATLDGEFLKIFNLLTYIDLDLFKLSGIPKSCIGTMVRQLVIGTVWPYIMVGFMAIGIVMTGILQNFLRKDSEPHPKTTLKKIIQVIIVVFYFTLPSVSKNTFDAIKCVSFRTNDEAEDNLESYLLADMTIRCDSDDSNFSTLKSLFWVFFTLWPVLTPLIFMVLLTRIGKSVRANSPTALADACRFLWEDYKPNMIFWDVLDIWRKLFLSGFIMFIDEAEGSNRIFRLSVATIVSSLYLGILTNARPYKREDDFYIAFLANLLLIFCFSLGTMLQLCNRVDGMGECSITEEGEYINCACKNFVGFSDPKNLSLAVVAIAFGMMIITALSLIAVVVNTSKDSTVIVVSSGYSPNVEVPKKCKYHFYISHSHVTGQAKVTKIIQQLESLLPRPKVLLSTDDVQDMDEVKFAVSTCATFILNYRAGYFRSTKCRQELVAAFEDDMPVIIIYEGEEASLLDKLRFECVTYFDNEPSSADILEHLFKHDPILWLHDDNDYHLAASMKKVYYFLLKSLPYYQGDRAELLDHGITVPGELGKVVLPCPLTILVCEGNEGAIQVASELLTLTGTGTTKLEVFGKSATDDIDKIVSKETFVDDIIPESSEAVYDLSGERKMILFLYLNKDTFLDDGASVQSLVRAAKDSMVDIVLVHEKDSTNGGCHFNHILEQTPIELIEHPYRLFDETAIPLYSPSEHRFISLRQILIRMGAVAKT